jgi:lipopolysaccharide heptosyltransferase I
LSATFDVPRFLLVRLGALGDIVHAIPVAAGLRRAFPDARIDWVVSARHRALLDLVPVVDHLIALGGRKKASQGLSKAAAIRTLREARYDWAIDMQGLMKSAIVARLSGAARVLGFARSYLREPLARFCYTDTYDPGASSVFDRRETRHIVEVNRGFLGVLNALSGPPEFPIAVVDTELAADVRRSTGGDYALLNPGAAGPNKRWPPERLGAVAESLSRRHQLPSIVLWGPGERELADEVVAHAGGAATTTPPTTIPDLVALARGACVMVSGDTGPTHIAAAVGTPIVGIYGPTRPARNGPWRPEDVTISRAEVCECHHLRKCRRARMCLLDIEADEVIAAVERRLADRSTRG